MQSDDNKVFYYHADASSLGGFIEAPFQKVIPAQASVSLPAVGGYATVRTESFMFEEIVSCRSAYTRVSGREIAKDGSWSTLVTSVVEGVNLLEVVTAERIVAQISVEHLRNGGARVSFAGTRFENLRLGGREVFPVLNSSLLASRQENDNSKSQGTWDTFLKVGKEQAHELAKSIQESDNRSAFQWALQRYGWMDSKRELQQDGCVLCSLVDGVEGAAPGRSLGHFVEIPDFGRVFLGELTVFPRAIQLTMVRAELGCNVQGKISMGVGGINGTTMPPY
ncbi:MAG TPA: hypothetical protein VHX63_14400 [Acidobacteriaceae bacterium]|jgi:hypothetical protein|nr:hypothetical protein [Acidobacteriaceae bacterium]